MNTAEIKREAGERNCSIKKLIVLAPQNDPFYVDTPGKIEQAEWFANLWQQYAGPKEYLRGFHYKLMSRGDITKPNGEVYQNTVNDWGYLSYASKYARYLGLIPFENIPDHKHPDPEICTTYSHQTEGPPSHRLYSGVDISDAEVSDDFDPWVSVFGYSYSDDNLEHHIEVVIEKSSMEDLLVPICEEYRANLVRSTGIQSITGARRILKRIASSGKPGIIFYISDFDPGGETMPISVSRQLEFWIREEYRHEEIKLDNLMLTPEQIEEYDLPRAPIKLSDKRKAGFEERRGKGAVELDALNALHPGEFERIVREAIAPYRDETYRARLGNADRQLRAMTKEALSIAMVDREEELEEIQAEIRALVDQTNEQLDEYRRRLRDIFANIEEGYAKATKDLEPPARPEFEIEGDPGTEWLFDSGRDYFEQIAVYRRKKQIED